MGDHNLNIFLILNFSFYFSIFKSRQKVIILISAQNERFFLAQLNSIPSKRKPLLQFNMFVVQIVKTIWQFKIK